VIALLGRLVISMAVVLGVMVLAAKVARNRNFGGIRRSRSVTIEVLARQPFGKTSSIAVVNVGGKTLVLGVTEQSVTVLTEADPSAIEIEAGPEAQWTAPSGGTPRPGQSWRVWIDQLRERTLRQ
jgi:flagellar protein FliO/FliZ